MDCNKCEHINITEMEQDKFKRERTRPLRIPHHRCTKYDKPLFHEWYMGKHLSKIKPCEGCEFSEL